MNHWIQPLLLAGLIVLAGMFLRLQGEVHTVQEAQKKAWERAENERSQTYLLIQDMHDRFGDGPVRVLEELQKLRTEYDKLMMIMSPEERAIWHREQHKHPQWGATVTR